MLATPAQALTYVGDWRLVIHADNEEDNYCPNGVCGTEFHVRTNQPAWEENGRVYDVNMTLDGTTIYADAGQNFWSEVDSDFAGVRAVGSIGTPLSKGVHTLEMEWFYMGTWQCGSHVPEGCAWVGRETVTKTYKFRWKGGADQIVRPYQPPSSSVSIKAKRTGAKVTLKGKVRARLLNKNFELSRPTAVKSAKVTLQSYSKKKRSWVKRKVVRSNKRGRVTHTIRSPKATKWRWVLKAKNGYPKAVSKVRRR